jgi:hypothetical protein
MKEVALESGYHGKIEKRPVLHCELIGECLRRYIHDGYELSIIAIH